MKSSEPISVLLVEDHVVVREGLAALLSLREEFRVVGQAGTGAEGVRLHAQLRPDVTLMDLNLPGHGVHRHPDHLRAR